MKNTLMSLLLLGLLAACASEKPKEAAAEGKTAPAQAAAPATGAATAAPEVAATPMLTPKAASATAPAAPESQDALLAKRSVFYPFDVAAVQEADLPVVRAHAMYLSAHPEQKVRLEGYCDERGSNEYNLALGQRRANGVEKMLISGGVMASQLESVSYGEEKPRATGHDEESWAQNRRTDINYIVK